jgi:hypothetical protein
MSKRVPVHSVFFLAMADDRLDGGAAFEWPMTTANRSLATAPWRPRFASGLLPPSYTTTGDVTLDVGVGDAAFLALGVDLEFEFFRGIVALVCGIGGDAGKRCTGRRFDAGKNRFQRMSVIRIAGQSLGVEDELSAL